MEDVEKIITGELRPFIKDVKGDDFYSPLFRGLAIIAPNFQPHYTINFPAPLFSSKIKYYKRLIDNSITSELNKLFELLGSSESDLILFHRKKLFEKIKSYIESVQRYIEINQFDLSEITSKYADFSINVQHNESTYIFNYVLSALFRCYLEFQAHYIQFIEEDKRQTISDFYTLILKKQVPENPYIEEVVENTIIHVPEEGVGSESTHEEISVSVQLVQDNYSRFVNEVKPYIFEDLPKFVQLSKENQKRLITLIVSNELPFAVAMLHFLEYPKRLKEVYSLNKEKQYSHIAKALGFSKRSVKGNFLVLSSTSDEDRSRYTSYLYENKVEEEYNLLLYK
jgi:hypothetical protein